MKYQKVQALDPQCEASSPSIRKGSNKHRNKTKHIILYCMFVFGALILFKLHLFIQAIEIRVDEELENQKKIDHATDKNTHLNEEGNQNKKQYQNGILSSLKNQNWSKKNVWTNQKPINQPTKIETKQQTKPEPKPTFLNPKSPKTPAVGAGVRGGITPQHRTQWVKYFALKNQAITSDMAKEQKEYYEKKYNISQYEELPICIFIPSFNNAKQKRYIHNMNSVLQQDYSNYYIIFIDDASDDKTGELIQDYARKHQISTQKLKIFINTERKMAMPNIFAAAHSHCKPWELFIIVDGDDELVGKQVLKNFNAAFQQQDMWLIYSNFLSFRGTIGYSRQYSKAVVQGNRYRRSPFMISHLRVFYSKLFTLIEEKDLKDKDGLWLRAANDVAMYLPMMEMCHKRLSYIPEISYMYNSNTGLNNHIVKAKEQKSNERMIKTRSSYKALESLFTEEELQKLKENKNKKIAIKDLNLPKEEGVEIYGWEL